MGMMAIDWKKIAHLSIDHNLTKRELAKRAELHYNTLYNEKEFRSTTVDKLAKVFGCNPIELIMIVNKSEVAQ